jgi:transposase-like protein
MKNPPPKRPAITIAKRGQIIQRVIVDGWTTAAVASAFGVPKRLVDTWVADFRRYGMASVRHERGQTIVATIVRLTISRPTRAILRKISIGRPFAPEPIVQPLPPRRSNKDSPR